MMENLRSQTEAALRELLEAARLREGDVLVVGCSSSEAAGQKIGTASSLEIAEAILEGILPLLEERGILLAAQCCEHLNRALILEAEGAERYGYAPAQGGRLLCDGGIPPVPGSGGGGIRSGAGRDGYWQYPDRDASGPGRRAGPAFDSPDRGGAVGLRPDTAEIYWRGTHHI